MRIHEILIESQQLDEGPLGAIGRGIGKVVGGVAKGVGAVAGGIAGAGTALKKGYQTGKAVVGDDPDPNKGQPGYDGSEPAAPKPGAPAAAAPAGAPAAAPAAGAAAPAAGAAAPAGAPPSAQDINAAGPAGTAPAKPQTGAAGAALAKTDAVTDKQTSTKAGETVYAQVKANVDKLDKKGKQRILQLLTKSMAAPDPKAAPAGGAPKPGAAPAAPKGNYDGNTGEPISDKGKADAASMAAFKASPKGQAQQAKWDAEDAAAAGQAPAADPAAPANTMANAPVSATNTAAADNPNQPPPKKTGGKVAGQLSQTPNAVRKRNARTAAASAKSAGAGAFGQMANTLQQQNASKNNYGNALSEALAQRVEAHKQKMFETGLTRGTVSVFRK